MQRWIGDGWQSSLPRGKSEEEMKGEIWLRPLHTEEDGGGEEVWKTLLRRRGVGSGGKKGRWRGATAPTLIVKELWAFVSRRM